jgi:hypothetical protein
MRCKPAPKNAGFVVRVHSPVEVMLVDPAGRRLGVDASGQAHDDLGDDGFDNGPGEPRTLAIRRPVSG